MVALGAALVVEEAAAIKAPGGAIVQIEMPVGAEVLAREELAVCLRHQARELLVAQLIELLDGDRSADFEFGRVHERERSERRIGNFAKVGKSSLALRLTGAIPTGLVNARIVHGCRLGRLKIRGVSP
jgi:hypothetical protein